VDEIVRFEEYNSKGQRVWRVIKVMTLNDSDVNDVKTEFSIGSIEVIDGEPVFNSLQASLDISSLESITEFIRKRQRGSDSQFAERAEAV
jgi:hypothetical protein